MTEHTVNTPDPFLTQTCPTCARNYFVPAHWHNVACPICQKATLVPAAQTRKMPSVELIVKPSLDKATIDAQLARFCKGSAFPYPDFKPENLSQRLVLVNWPIWLTDGDLKGAWDATFGYDYQVESSREQMGNAGWSSQKVIKTRVKDEPRKGFIQRHYDNVLSPALHSHQERLSQIGSYQLNQAGPGKAEDIATGLTQIGTIAPSELEDFVKQELSKRAAQDCRLASDAQHIRNFTFNGDYNNLRWTQALLPMLASYYTDDKGNRHVVTINGQNGAVYGQRMASVKKAGFITGILLAVAIILMLILYFAKVDFFICSSVLLILAFIPLIRAASWNNKEKNKRPPA